MYIYTFPRIIQETHDENQLHDQDQPLSLLGHEHVTPSIPHKTFFFFFFFNKQIRETKIRLVENQYVHVANDRPLIIKLKRVRTCLIAKEGGAWNNEIRV